MGELDAAVELLDQYRQYYGQEADPEAARAFLATRMSAGESVIYLVNQDGGGWVGFAQLYPTYSSVSLKRLWVLNDLFVAPDARSSGIGRALIERSFELARSTDAKGVVLETMKDNHRAKALYELLGFRVDPHCDHYEWLGV